MRENSVAANVLDVLKSVLSSEQDTVSLHAPRFSGHEWDYLKECLDTGWVSSVGKFVDRFEADLAAYTGHRHAVAVVNGTAALHASLQLVGVEAGDEVLLPALTFVATANAVSYCGAIPHFVDCEERTLGIDPHKLSDYLERVAERRASECYNRITGRRIKAVVPMHTFGHPVDLDALVAVCDAYALQLVEDCAESLGSFYKGKHTGHGGRLAAVSFNGNKIITTGGGGAILTNDPDLAKRAKHLTTTAKLPHAWAFHHDMIGYNYRMPNLNAALGCAQLEQLPTFLEIKRQLAEQYRAAFERVPGVRYVGEPEFARSNFWLNALMLDDAKERDKCLDVTNSAGIMTRPVWALMHRLPMYETCPRMDLSVSERFEAGLINIPSGVEAWVGSSPKTTR